MSWKILTHPKTSLFLLGSLKDVCFLTVILVTPLWNLRGTAVLIFFLRDTEKGIRTRAQSKKVPTSSNAQVISLIFFFFLTTPANQGTLQTPHSLLSGESTKHEIFPQAVGGPFLLVRRCGFWNCLQTEAFELAVMSAWRHRGAGQGSRGGGPHSKQSYFNHILGHVSHCLVIVSSYS